MNQRTTIIKWGINKGRSRKDVRENPGPIEVEDKHFVCDRCQVDIRPIGETRKWHKIFNKFCANCGHEFQWEKKVETTNE